MASHRVAKAPAAVQAGSHRGEGDGVGGRVDRPSVWTWLPAGLTALVFAGLILWQMFLPRPYFTGTNSVGVASIVASVNPGQELCVPGLRLPAGTAGVRLALFAQRPSVRVAITVKASGRGVAETATAPVSASRANLLAYPSGLSALAAGRPSAAASVCFAPFDGPVSVGGTAGLEYGRQPASIRARGAAPVAVANRIAVWFVPPAGSERSLISSLGSIFSRAALFRPGFVGPWTYPVLLFAVLPASWLLSLLLFVWAARGRVLELRGRRLRIGLVIGAIAFLNAGSWALITPAFQTPDEPDHFAYVQYFAETGHQPSKVPSAQAAFSTEQVLALNAVDAYSTISNREARPPWLKSDERMWKQLRAGMIPHPRDNGGGYTPAAAIHDPPYYALGALAYMAVKGQSVFSQLTAVRLVSALLGAIVAMCAFALVRELLPRWPVAAVTAGLLVAYHPMFGFISGAVNDDSGVNAAAAVSLYLLVRMLRRGLRWREALGFGAALALAPLMKETGYEVYPAAAIGIAALLWRELRGHPLLARIWARRASLAALAGSFVAVVLTWALIKPHVLHAAVGQVAESAAGVSTTGTVSLAQHMPGRFAVYLWELFLPRLSFMGSLFPPGWPFFQIYVQRGWASFGWYTFGFPHWVYVVIVFAMAGFGLLAMRTAWAARRWARGRIWELLLILLFPLCTLLAVEAAFFTPTGGRTVVAEQGRYIFPAIAALAAIVVAATFALGRRLQPQFAAVVVVAMIGLSYASQLLTLGSFYT